MIARKLFFFGKYKYFNSLSNATHPIQIHKAVLEKLRFEKKVKKILTSNISEIYGSILLPKELSRLVYKIYRYKKISKRLSQFYSNYVTTKKSLFFINYFFSPKIMNKKT